MANSVNAQEEPRPAWDTYGMLINDTPGNTPQTAPQIICDGDGNAIVIWEDGRGGYTNIYAQKLDSGGSPLWEKQGVALSLSSGNSNFPRITDDGAGGAIVAWQDYRHGNADIFAQRITRQGSILWGKDGTAVSSAKSGQFSPEIVADGAGGAIIAWHDYRGAAGEDIYAQRIDKEGNPVWEKDGIPISVAAGTQWFPKIISDGSGGAIIVWADGRKSSSDNDIYAQRMDASGKVLWKADGVAICQAGSNQERPEIIFLEEQKAAIAVWNDFRAGNCDLFA
jgi:hypothetical protein